MARIVPQKKGGWLKVFEKGDRGNPKGRPKKFATLVKDDLGYSKTQILDTLNSMQGMSQHQLQYVRNHHQATVLERTLAKALYDAMSKGDMAPYDGIWDRTIGKPKIVVEPETPSAPDKMASQISTVDPVAAARDYQKIMRGE